MSKTIVIADASPLIALARIEQLDLLRHLFESVYLTDTVQQEIFSQENLPDAQRIKQAIDSGWLQAVDMPVSAQHSLYSVMHVEGLDAGEATSLLYADRLQNSGESPLVLIDEAKGRKIARRLDLDLIGTVGVLAIAKQEDLIASVRPLLKQLQESGYYLSERVIAQGLVMAGED